MKREEFLRLMAFPPEWEELEMIPDDLWRLLNDGYEVGHEQSGEHDRNGAFHWWLRQSPGKEILLNLVALSFLDPDQIMASDVRRYIRNSKHSDDEVVAAIEKKTC